ncbi:multidrug effflux MFS transporter [Sphingomonas sp. LY160]|uniref:multidrug effflux MFS transporter n=1 Tax=Sphingomonas sp. LY160 TaxID=3095342 RepID=UPI002ADED5BF|nr:multidrug effflux MFS transporter [Sphingomonas sp. LY160]MEA1071313.1 multidrug effflux MFS transporter [Sphingomonas sp. LY160]
MPFEMPKSRPGQRRIGARETVALLAGLMALNAFAIDAMLPALPAIGESLGVTDENRRQLVVVLYMAGFGSTQLLWGPLADRFGRKPILALGVILYGVFAALCGFASDFPILVAARFGMGASAAVTRVLVTAMVRDLFEGEQMARVMSLVFMVFMLIPMLAPSVGQLILLVGSWRLIFIVLAVYALIMWLWSYARLSETLHLDNRRLLEWRTIGTAVTASLRERLSLGYTLGLTAVFGGLTGYIASIQQIVFDTFQAPAAIGAVFAAVAAPMAFGSWLNSRLVGRFGLRRVGHVGLIAFVIASVGHLLIAATLGETLWMFVVLQALAMGSFAFTSSNFGTLAMTNMAKFAGTASSVQGTIQTIGGAAIGFVIGQSFDGTQIPFLAGMAACSIVALIAVLIIERGRFFGPIEPPVLRA